MDPRGDRIPEEEADYAVIRAMAEGLRLGDQGRHLMTYHPQGGYGSSDFFHDEAWLDFNTPWRQALTYPGAFQAGYMRFLFESRSWWTLQPAPSLLQEGPNTAGKEVIVARATDSRFVMAYSPFGSPFTLSLAGMSSDLVRVWWFNPRNGTHIDAGAIEATSQVVFDPPGNERRGNDWVLLVDVDPTLPAPGTRRE